MKIFTAKRIREIDAITIAKEPIASIDLMERAATRLAEWIRARYEISAFFIILSGPGNNGGDGLALARILSNSGYRTRAYLVGEKADCSADCLTNYNRLLEREDKIVEQILSEDDFPQPDDSAVVIDALFGTGVTRPMEGIYAKLISRLNESECEVISVDIPSGLYSEDNTTNVGPVVNASHTLTLQFPKIAFFFPENGRFTGLIEVIPIDLLPRAIYNTPTDYYYSDIAEVAGLIPERRRFDHKGSFGHTLVAAGSIGKMGAAFLAAKAALRSGAGLVTCHLPASGNDIIQSSLPEAMTRLDQSDIMITDICSPEKYSAIAVGPGMGTKPNAQKAVKKLLEEYKGPLVIDADAINIIAMNPEWKAMLRAGIVLTPHPGEFDRLMGPSGSSFERLALQRDFSIKHEVVVVLKGANSSVSFPDGTVYFNSTGNPGMATAGSGDVLTGVIASLLGQGLTAQNAAVAGVFIHGLAGDIAAKKRGEVSLIATDIIKCLGEAFLAIKMYQ